MPHTPVRGAKRSGRPMSIPALPSASHANPRLPCVASRATHSAATEGIAHQRPISVPASSANTPM